MKNKLIVAVLVCLSVIPKLVSAATMFPAIPVVNDKLKECGSYYQSQTTNLPRDWRDGQCPAETYNKIGTVRGEPVLILLAASWSIVPVFIVILGIFVLFFKRKINLRSQHLKLLLWAIVVAAAVLLSMFVASIIYRSVLFKIDPCAGIIC